MVGISGRAIRFDALRAALVDFFEKVRTPGAIQRAIQQTLTSASDLAVMLGLSVVENLRAPAVIRTFSVFAFAIIVLGAGCFAARACHSPGGHISLFFDDEDLAAGVDGPTIAEVMITAISSPEDYWGDNKWADKSHWVVLARVTRVVKGSIDSDVIKLLVYPSSCGPFNLHVGQKGIVVGVVRRDAQQGLEMVPRQESVDSRQRRKSSTRN